MPNSPRRWLALNYAATIFISAFLLFQVQPLVSKYILPWFGGSPAVWTTCMLFFQSLLFAGYAYAHFSAQHLRPRQQAVLHLAIILMALVVVFLGVVPSESWKPGENSTDPVGRILLLLGASIGLPYFVLSTTGPLVQSWFAKSFPGRTPYRLYALSNIGSLLALLSYPVLFERLFDVKYQAWFWGCGFMVFAGLCAGAAINLWKLREIAAANGNGGSTADADDGQAAMAGLEVDPTAHADDAALPDRAPPLWQRTLWLVLPALASITLLATTNHVCTDVAVMPFLWVIPLALYLTTFIVAFDHPRWYKPGLIALATLVSIYWVGVGKGETDLFDLGVVGGWIGNVCHWVRGVSPSQPIDSLEIYVGLYPFLAINFLAMFGMCLLCHGELVRQKPHPRYLTSFYLMISAGGAIGGILVTLVAPHLFKTYFEWDLITYLGFIASAGVLLWTIVRAASLTTSGMTIGKPLAALLTVLLLFAATVGGIDLYTNLAGSYSTSGVLSRSRNFFGTLLVREFKVDSTEHYLEFKHGATTHGRQYVFKGRAIEPTTYYTEFGGVGRAIDYFNDLPQAPALVEVEERAEAAEKAGMSKADIKTQEKADKAANATVAAKVRDAEHARGFAGQNDAGKRKSGLKIGAVGLGAGTLASYVGPGDSITFYEINPAVIDIADSGKYFTFLPDCRKRGGKCDVKLGDARLTLDRELHDADPQRFDLLVLDAFSGDAIPAHLLT
ncbi:MAG TPA: hypothetical protein VGJ15_13870, partial [Pirellulales bacterium]